MQPLAPPSLDQFERSRRGPKTGKASKQNGAVKYKKLKTFYFLVCKQFNLPVFI